MSDRICGKCKSTQVEKIGYSAGTFTEYLCKVCGRFGMGDAFPKATVFQQITQSPEELAQRLVYKILYRGLDRRLHPGWKSTIIYDADFYVRDEAVAATVAKLKEVGIE
jgi:hypothetical protein